MDEQGIIFDLQRFSVHDGPGIRTLIFFKGCPLRCVWCSNPESYRQAPELLFDSTRCVGCRACVAACPHGVLRVEGDRISDDRARCHGCGRCAVACAAEARVLRGATVTAAAVTAEAMRDAPFFANSGGGVTLGGGEPLLQPEFARGILRACQANGVHTAIETCGHVAWTSFEEVLPYTDLFLFDVKHLDPPTHHAHTGGDVSVIQANLERLSAAARAVIVRVPVVPTFNDTPDDLSAIADRVAALGLSHIHLLPYHPLGQSKHRLLGGPAPPPALPKLSAAHLAALSRLVAARGVSVTVGG